MTPEEFMDQVPPDLLNRSRSKLEPHREAILKLRAANYSLLQVCDYLERCGVVVSFQMLSKFLRGPRNASMKPATIEQALPSPVAAVPARMQVDKAQTGTKSREEIAAEDYALSKKQVEEKYVDQFQRRVENPLLRRRK